jgi:hypothetical protein
MESVTSEASGSRRLADFSDCSTIAFHSRAMTEGTRSKPCAEGTAATTSASETPVEDSRRARSAPLVTKASARRTETSWLHSAPPAVVPEVTRSTTWAAVSWVVPAVLYGKARNALHPRRMLIAVCSTQSPGD